MYKQQILTVAKENNGLITAAQARQFGLPSVYLSRMVNEGSLHRVARGVYALSTSSYDPWFILQAQNPVCIFSYTSALYLQQASDLVPGHAEVSVYAGYNASHLPQGTVIHYVRRDVFKLGEVSVTTQYGNTVRCYNMARTVCDIINDRHRTDSELFSKTLQHFIKHYRTELNKLMQYAKRMGIQEKVRSVIEVLI